MRRSPRRIPPPQSRTESVERSAGASPPAADQHAWAMQRRVPFVQLQPQSDISQAIQRLAGTFEELIDRASVEAAWRSPPSSFQTPWTCPSRPGKDGGEIAAVAAPGEISVSQPDLGVVRTEQVGPVWGAVHPPVKGALRRGGGGVSGREDVLADPRPVISLILHSIAYARPIGSGVRKEPIAGHILAVPARCGLQLRLEAIAGQLPALSLGVDQCEQGRLVGRVACRRTIAGRRGTRGSHGRRWRLRWRCIDAG